MGEAGDGYDWARVLCAGIAYLATIAACVAGVGWIFGLAIGIFLLGPLAAVVAMALAPLLVWLIGACVLAFVYLILSGK